MCGCMGVKTFAAPTTGEEGDTCVSLDVEAFADPPQKGEGNGCMRVNVKKRPWSSRGIDR